MGSTCRVSQIDNKGNRAVCVGGEVRVCVRERDPYAATFYYAPHQNTMMARSYCSTFHVLIQSNRVLLLARHVCRITVNRQYIQQSKRQHQHTRQLLADLDIDNKKQKQCILQRHHYCYLQ